jgi:hypothetical protein
MWKEYDACKDPYQRSKILISIADVQPYLSSYYDAIHQVVSHAHEDDYGNKFKLFNWKDVLEANDDYRAQDNNNDKI